MVIDLYPVRLQTGSVCHMSIPDLVLYAESINKNPAEMARKISLHVYSLVLVHLFYRVA